MADVGEAIMRALAAEISRDRLRIELWRIVKKQRPRQKFRT